MVLCAGMQNNGQQLPVANVYEVIVAEAVLSLEEHCAFLAWFQRQLKLCRSPLGLCVEAPEEALVAILFGALDLDLVELVRIHPLLV